MRVYVTTQGASIVKEGGHLLVRCGKDIHHTVFVHKMNQLILCGNITLTPPARNVLFKNNIDTVFLSRNGRYIGRFCQMEPKNIELRKQQFARAADTDFALVFAKAIVAGKLANMTTILMRIHRKQNNKHLVEQTRRLRSIISQSGSATSVEMLRGYEGQGSAIYFSLFNRGFDQDQGFMRRVRRPPTDPVNAVLSLLYTFLYNQVYSAIRQAHLDPYLGHLHSLDYGRYSLVLDLMEEFRPVIVDSLVFTLFNMRILKKDEDFLCREESATKEQEEDEEAKLCSQAKVSGNELFDTPVQRMEERFTMAPLVSSGHRPVQLREEAMKKVIVQFERKLATNFTYEPEDRRITYAEAMVRQARMYRRCMDGSQNEYRPLLIR